MTFAIYIGLSGRGALQVDLAVGVGVTGEITTASPGGALDLPRLATHPYRLYPVIDQIADKVCATMTTYGERPSSREKDLVDLVVFATTHDIDGSALRRAIAIEARRRQIDLPAHFAVPASWGAGYGKLSNSLPTAPATALSTWPALSSDG
ncbi:nucleotidyl transferase AbiEii/AbiGii toxin family protein [uncultured Friedmanniella sp.]|uniref:nucleotidyl transferase AbiEii/AbiGii toxin family protein n=1 Tax=uncultured Friedmanniella sp. TaxID=335381 RepID=UPI0035CB246E